MYTHSIVATGELSTRNMLAQSPGEVISLSYVDAARIGDVVKYVDTLIPAAVVDEYIGGGGDVEVVVAGDGEVPHPAGPVPGGVAAQDGGAAARWGAQVSAVPEGARVDPAVGGGPRTGGCWWCRSLRYGCRPGLSGHTGHDRCTLT